MSTQALEVKDAGHEVRALDARGVDAFPATLNTDDVYKMVYKDRSRIETIHFHFPSTGGTSRDRLQGAINRAKKYCEALRFRFVHCELFLVNLEEKEKQAAETY